MIFRNVTKPPRNVTKLFNWAKSDELFKISEEQKWTLNEDC